MTKFWLNSFTLYMKSIAKTYCSLNVSCNYTFHIYYLCGLQHTYMMLVESQQHQDTILQMQKTGHQQY